MSKTKKIILLVSMVVVLAVAAYLNIMLLSKKSGENGGGDVQSTSTFFNTCREDRDTARKEEIANLDAIMLKATNTKRQEQTPSLRSRR